MPPPSFYIIYGILLFAHFSSLEAVGYNDNYNQYFPRINEGSINTLMDIANQMNGASDQLNTKLCVGLMYSVKTQVENMTGAQVRLDQFVDDAFAQAEAKGMRFSAKQKEMCRWDLLLMQKGASEYPIDLFNFNEELKDITYRSAYKKYEDCKHYEAPARLEVGLTMVIVGSLVAFVPGCAPAGAIIAGTGFNFMAECCINGHERNSGR